MPPRPSEPPAQHFNYDELEVSCHCDLCSEQRSTIADYTQRKRDTRKHPADCECFMCDSKRAAALDMRVASNKWTIYSELSFLTNEHRLGPDFLRWVYGLMKNEAFRNAEWWAVNAMQLPLRSWMDEWHRQYLPKEVLAVSGLY